MRHSDILKLVRAETDQRPDAFSDFLDALTLAANNVSEQLAERPDPISARHWLQIASTIAQARRLVDEEIRRIK
jgi:hypothetical protein